LAQIFIIVFSSSIFYCSPHNTVETKAWFLWQVSSLEDCPKSSVNPEINQSEAGPDIADEAQLHSGDGKLHFIFFILSSLL